MITGYDLVNEYYEDEKLYSTGNDDLDDLLEKAFCDGYEYAQREFGNKENKKAQRQWKIDQALKENKGSKDGEYHYARSEEIRRMRDEAKKTGKLTYGIRGSGNSEKATEFNRVHKKESPDVMIDYQPKYTDYTKEESALHNYRQKNKKVTDPIAQREINTRTSVVTDNLTGKQIGGGTYEKKVSDKDLKEEQDMFNRMRKGKSSLDVKVERASDKEMRERLKDPKVRAKIAKQRFKRKMNNTTKQVGSFMKDHKGAVIGGTLGTAALVGGGIALHRYNKKKREQQEKEGKED